MVTVFCTSKNNFHNFYIADGKKEYYLFSQKYRGVINQFYSKGVTLDRAIKHSEGKGGQVLHHTMNKLKLYIKYIEKEYDIVFLNSTRKKVGKPTLRKEWQYGSYRF